MKLQLIIDENIPNSVVNKLRKNNYSLYSIREKKKGIEDKKIIKLSKETNNLF